MRDEHKSRTIVRRDFLKTTSVAGAGLALTGLSSSASAQKPVEAPSLHLKPYAGKTLTIYQQTSPIFEGAFDMIQPHFEHLTGAKMRFVSIPSGDMGQRIALSLTSDPGEMDVTWYYNIYPLMKQGLFEPIDTFISDPNLTPPDWNYADYLPAPLATGAHNGRQYCLVVTANAMGLYYRKDKLAQAGFVDDEGNAKPPLSWDEVMSYSEVMDSGKDRPLLLMYSPSSLQLVMIWLSTFLSQDYIYLWDETGKCIVNNADGVAAIRQLKMLLKWASPTCVTWDFPEAHAAFQLNKGALFPNWNNLGGIYNDQENSLAAGKFSLSVWPRMRINTSTAGHWHSCIAHNTPNKELAWILVREYNSHEWQKKFFMSPVVTFNPSRASVLRRPRGPGGHPLVRGDQGIERQQPRPAAPHLGVGRNGDPPPGGARPLRDRRYRRRPGCHGQGCRGHRRSSAVQRPTAKLTVQS